MPNIKRGDSLPDTVYSLSCGANTSCPPTQTNTWAQLLRLYSLLCSHLEPHQTHRWLCSLCIKITEQARAAPNLCLAWGSGHRPQGMGIFST